MQRFIVLKEAKEVIFSKYTETITKLIYQTGTELYSYQFISKKNCSTAISQSWLLPHSLFEYQNATLAIKDDKLIGIEIGFRGEEFKSRRQAMHPIWKKIPRDDLKVISKRSKECSYLTPFIPNNVYYVLTLSVLSGHQRRGVGRMLINSAIKKARKFGIHKIHLDVVSTYSAVRFYESMGFKCVVRSSAPIPKQNNVPTMMRMAVNLQPTHN